MHKFCAIYNFSLLVFDINYRVCLILWKKWMHNELRRFSRTFWNHWLRKLSPTLTLEKLREKKTEESNQQRLENAKFFVENVEKSFIDKLCWLTQLGCDENFRRHNLLEWVNACRSNRSSKNITPKTTLKIKRLENKAWRSIRNTLLHHKHIALWCFDVC